MKVKVFGERNTGTRATIRMLNAAVGVDAYMPSTVPDTEKANLASLEDHVSTAFSGAWRRVYRETVRDQRDACEGPLGQWKHTAPSFHQEYRRRGVSALFLVRNPYSWLLSLHRRPYHYFGPRDEGFDLFIRRPWKTLGRDRLSPILETPLALWNKKLNSYARFANEAADADVPTTYMSFENFVDNPPGALGGALNRIGALHGRLRTIAPTKRMGKAARERRHYYGQELWRADLTSDDVEFINSRIDWDLAGRHGYHKLEPEAFVGNVDQAYGRMSA